MPRNTERRRSSMGSNNNSSSESSTSSGEESSARGGDVGNYFETTNNIDFVSKNPPPVFTELLELTTYSDGFQEWKEIARWIKYEETVEIEGNRWSKPHVSTPKLQGWLQASVEIS